MYSQTSLRGAATMTDSFSLTPTPASHRSRRSSSADDREAALGGKAVERLLHDRGPVVIYRVGIRVVAELLAHVDRRQDLDRHLGRQRQARNEVADADPPWWREQDRQHLQPQPAAVEAQSARQPRAAAEEDRRLLAADRDHRDDRDV